jgi:hypothetical protein
MEEDYLPAQMSGTQTKLLYGAGSLFAVFAIVTWVLVLVRGIHDVSWMLIALPLAIFIATTLVLVRWMRDGGVPDNADHLKYMTIGNMLGMLIISIGLMSILLAGQVTCKSITISSGTSGCSESQTMVGGKCVFSCNCGYGFPAPKPPTTSPRGEYDYEDGYASDYEYDSSIYSETGYTDTKSITCGATGSWSDAPPTCSPLTCPALTAPTNGAVNNADPAGPRCDADMDASQGMNICIYSCVSGALSTSPYNVCTQSGTWSIKDTPECR